MQIFRDGAMSEIDFYYGQLLGVTGIAVVVCQYGGDAMHGKRGVENVHHHLTR